MLRVATMAVLAGCVLAGARAVPAPDPWTTEDAGGRRVVLHFAWTAECPHCRRARPFVRDLGARHGWLQVNSLEVTRDADARRRFVELAALAGARARAVPAFLFCGTMMTGFESAATTGRALEQALLACRDESAGHGAPPAAGGGDARVTIPLLGRIDPAQASLPVVTVVLAALDAFNPCAFFVLLCLLGVMLHGGSRARMLVTGLVFVAFSGIMYFVFMAAWMNVFLLLGPLRVVTVAAGVVALVMGLLNLKDFMRVSALPSLSIPERARPRLYERLRAVITGTGWTGLIGATAVLAAAANSYELLCTAGLPMIYTRILTLEALPPVAYYLYLVLYNAVYVLPLLIIVAAVAATLGEHRLSERQGRLLKLLSGVMMTELALVLLIAPGLLNSLLVPVLLLASAIAVALIATLAGRWRRHA